MRYHGGMVAQQRGSRKPRPRAAAARAQPVAAAQAPGARAMPVKSLSKGLRTLEMLLASESVGTTEVALALGVDKSAASRILHTLAHCGFALQGAGRRYQAGPKLRARAHALTLPAGVSIRERARPLLERLHEFTHETAHLAVRADDQVLYLDKVDTDLPLRVDRPVGTLSPLHCTALGKIFLAFADAPLPRKLASFTSRTPVSREALQEAIDRIRSVGYSVDDEEFAPGIRCVAAPLRDASGHVIAAIGVSGPTARIAASHLDDLGVLVKGIAEQFSL